MSRTRLSTAAARRLAAALLLTAASVWVAGPVLAAQAQGAGEQPEGAAKTRAGAAASPAATTQSEASSTPLAETLPGVRLRGEMGVGFHFVSTNGHLPKYREDIDLSSGIYLRRSRVELNPGGNDPASWADRIVVEGHGFGGHPSDSWAVTAQKTGAYKLRVRSRSMDYFNQITGSPLAWDLTRNNAEGTLSVNARENLTFHASFRRFRQSRFRHTSRDISRNEFEFEEPLDQDGTVWGLGARWRLGTTSMFFDQQFSQFEDNARFMEDELNTGLSVDEAFLTYLEDRQVRSVNAPITRAGVATRVGSKLRLSADMLHSGQEMGFSWVRLWEGANFQQRPVTESVSASGEARRQVFHTNGRVLYSVSDDLRFTARYRRRSWDQDGDQVFGSTTAFTAEGGFSVSIDQFASDWRIILNQVLLGAEVSPSDSVMLFGEFGLTMRDQEFTEASGTLHGSETDTTSFRVGTRFRPSARLDFEGSYSRDDVDDPFTRISPTATDRIVGKVRVRPGAGWSLIGSITHREAENDLTPATLTTTAYGVTVAYNAGPERWMMAGYNRVRLDREVLTNWRPFFGGSVTDTFTLDLADSTLSFAGEYRVSDRTPLTLYGRAAYVDSASVLPVGTVFGGLGRRLRAGADLTLDYLDLTFGGRYLFDEGLFVDLGYRYVDYDEESALASASDDYDANVLTLGVGFRF